MGAVRESQGLAKVMEPMACDRRRADVIDDTEPDELESCNAREYVPSQQACELVGQIFEHMCRHRHHVHQLEAVCAPMLGWQQAAWPPVETACQRVRRSCPGLSVWEWQPAPQPQDEYSPSTCCLSTLNCDRMTQGKKQQC